MFSRRSTTNSIPSSASSYTHETSAVIVSNKSLSIPMMAVTSGIGMTSVSASSKSPNEDAPKMNRAV